MKKNKPLKTFIEKKRNEHKEDVAREVRTYGQVRPMEAQLGTKTWKSYSRVRYTSGAYRTGYDTIRWEG